MLRGHGRLDPNAWRGVDWHADGALPAWRIVLTLKEADMEGWLP